MLADEQILSKWNATSVDGGVTIKNWTIKTGHGSICSESSKVGFCSKLCNHTGVVNHGSDDRIHVNGALLHMPNMLYLDNYVSFSTEDHVFVFNCQGALQCWLANHHKGLVKDILKVPFAWKNREITEETSWDWTFSESDYCVSVGEHVYALHEMHSANPFTVFLHMHEHTSSTESSYRWISRSNSGINVALLQERLDILFFDDVVLYQVRA